MNWYKDRTIKKEQNYRNFYRNHLEDEKNRQHFQQNYKYKKGGFHFKHPEKVAKQHGKIPKFYNPKIFKPV